MTLLSTKTSCRHLIQLISQDKFLKVSYTRIQLARPKKLLSALKTTLLLGSSLRSRKLKAINYSNFQVWILTRPILIIRQKSGGKMS